MGIVSLVFAPQTSSKLFNFTILVFAFCLTANFAHSKSAVLKTESGITPLGKSPLSHVLITSTAVLNPSPIAPQKRDSAFIINGRLIVRLKDSAVVPFGRLIRSEPNLPQSAANIRNSLQQQGINKYRYLHSKPNTPFTRFVVLDFDTSHNIVAKYNALKNKPFVDRVYYDYRWNQPVYLGGFQYHDSSYAMEGERLNWDWIRHENLYDDGDMSIVEAWEFTKGDTNLIIAVDGGFIYCVPNDITSGPIDQELFGNILLGYNFRKRLDSLICKNRCVPPPDTCQLLWSFCDSLIKPLDTWTGGLNDAHGTVCAKLITARHDTTGTWHGNSLSGEIGFAPGTKIIPYYTNAIGSWSAEAIFDAANRGAFAYSRSLKIFNDSAYVIGTESYLVALGYEIVRDAAEEAFQQTGMLFVNGFGNYGTDQYPSSQNGIAVSTFNGSKGSTAALSGKDVTLCGYGGHGSGTSFSTPTVAAVAALVKSLNPQMTGAQIREKLLQSCNPLRDTLWSADTSISKLGRGALDAYQAISTKLENDITSDTTLSGPIYVAKTITVQQGATLRIKLDTLVNGVYRTHVRFATRNYENPYEIQRTKIIVEGNLIVEGHESEKILFSSLRNDEQIEPWKWTGRWGGIEIRNGGHADIRHALIEKALWPLTVQSNSSIELRNSEIYGSDSGGVNINSSSALLEECQIQNVVYGVYVTGQNAYASIRKSLVSDYSTSGIEINNLVGTADIDSNVVSNGLRGIAICQAEARITSNQVSGNTEYGIGVVNGTAHIVGNSCFDNSGHGIWHAVNTNSNDSIAFNIVESNGFDAPDDNAGILVEQSFLYRVFNNFIAYNPVGIRSESGLVSARFAQDYAKNILDSNKISLRMNSFALSELGVAGITEIWGGWNSSKVYPQQGGANIYHVLAENSSAGYYQCDIWTPDSSGLFQAQAGSFIRQTPDSSNCQLLSPGSGISESMRVAINLCYNRDYGQAYNIYESIVNDPFTTDNDLRLALAGTRQLYFLDPNRLNGQIDTLLRDLAIAKSASNDNIRASIAYIQSFLAHDQDEYVRMDSLLRFADANITDASELRNIRTMLLFVNLYHFNFTATADSILGVMYAVAPPDPLVSSAQNLRNLYRNDGLPPMPKQENRSFPDTRQRTSRDEPLLHVYPNPANPTAIVRFKVPQDGFVSLRLFDSQGALVKTLVNRDMQLGIHSSLLQAGTLASGVYYLVLKTGFTQASFRLFVLK